MEKPWLWRCWPVNYDKDNKNKPHSCVIEKLERAAEQN